MPALRRNPDGSLHVHTYARMSKKQYRCLHPLCNHYIGRSMLLGKASICAICQEQQIILDSAQLQLAKPRCINCANTEEAKTHKMRTAALDELFSGGKTNT